MTNPFTGKELTLSTVRLNTLRPEQLRPIDEQIAAGALEGLTARMICDRIRQATGWELTEHQVLNRRRSSKAYKEIEVELRTRGGELGPAPGSDEELLVWARRREGSMVEMARIVKDKRSTNKDKIAAVQTLERLREAEKRDELELFRLEAKAIVRELVAEYGYTVQGAIEELAADLECVDPTMKQRILLELQQEIPPAASSSPEPSSVSGAVVS
jgi:hypothetical protein